MRPGEDYQQVAARLAAVLRQKLTDEEFRDLIDLDGDRATSDMLLRELLMLRGKKS